MRCQGLLGGSTKALAPARLESRDDSLKLWIVGAFVIVPETLLRVAARTRDGQVFDIIGSAVVPRHDVLESRRPEWDAILGQGELRLTMNALPLPNRCALLLLELERTVGRGRQKEESLFAGFHWQSATAIIRRSSVEGVKLAGIGDLAHRFWL